MKKLRVLGIAPYNNLALLMQQAAKKRTDIEMTVYTGDLEDGARIASQYTGMIMILLFPEVVLLR
ncbi:MAG: hypothetical protein V8Q57_06495 [Blautia sp.]